jgi:hypothetical protein
MSIGTSQWRASVGLKRPQSRGGARLSHNPSRPPLLEAARTERANQAHTKPASQAAGFGPAPLAMPWGYRRTARGDSCQP